MNWLNQLPGPETAHCEKCKQLAVERGNPMGVTFLSVVVTAYPEVQHLILLCEPCSFQLSEWLNPEQLDDAGYIAQKDQYFAKVRDWMEDNG